MKDKINTLKNAAGDAIDFIKKNKNATPDFSNIANELAYNAALVSSRAGYAADILSNHKTIGVFGESQAGKSYLVSKFVTDGVSDLKLLWDKKEYSFIGSVNPPGGGKESSAFVTRFSSEAYKAPEGYPVFFRLFNEAEIVKILINSFFNDYDPKTITLDFNKIDFKAHLEKCDNPDFRIFDDKEKKCTLTFEQIYSLFDYIKDAGRPRFDDMSFDHEYILYGLENLPLMNIEGRSFYFSVLFDSLKVISALYRRLVRALCDVDYTKALYAPVSVFVDTRADGSVVKKDDSIIRVEAIKDIMRQSNPVNVCLDEDGLLIRTIDFAALAVLIREFVLNPMQSSIYVKTFDVLDMPGARSRELSSQLDLKAEDERFQDTRSYLESISETSLTAKVLNEKLRRGKVAFLFDRYCECGEFEVLLYCISAASPNQEVRTLPGMLRRYVENNIGSTPEQRARNQNTLVGVFTQFDVAVEKQITNNLGNNGRPDTKALVDAILDDFKAEYFMSNFAGAGNEFKNFFIVRNPAYTEHSIWLDENGVKDEQRENYKVIVNDFLHNNSTFVKRVREPEKMFENLVKPDGGVGYLADYVYAQYSSQAGREIKFLEQIKSPLQSLQALNSFATREGGAARINARRHSLDIAYKLVQLDSAVRIFYRLKDRLEPDFFEIEQSYVNTTGGSLAYRRFAEDITKIVLLKIESLNGGSLCKSLSESVADEILAKEDDLDSSSYPFIYESGRIKNRNTLIKEIAALFTQYAIALKDIFLSRIDFEEKLKKILDDETLAGVGSYEHKGIYISRALDFISEFFATFGMTIIDEMQQRRLFIADPDKDILSLQESDAKELTDNRLYMPVAATEYGIIKTDNNIDKGQYYENLYIADYMSNFICMYEEIKSAGVKSVFDRETNEALCSIIDRLEVIKE